jgi:hypothetical protein
MAEEKAAPIVKLPPEVQARLGNLKKEIEGARRGIEALKNMGMDTRALEDRLEWAEGVRKTLLNEFT